MAKKGSSRHLKRYAAPRVLKLPRKSKVWTVKPAPGPHPSDSSVPLLVLLRDYLELARTAREAKRILADRQVLVDGKVRRDPKFPVGLMDVVQLPAINRSYRILFDGKGRLVPREIPQAETSFKLCRVTKKITTKGNRIQLALHDGRTLVGDFQKVRPRDVLKLSLPKGEVMEHIPFEKGSVALVTGGENVGMVGNIIDIKLIEGSQPNIVTLQSSNGTTFQAPEDYV
ncbi:MAG: 30S ribosomal protein S4e, partial [Hadesarchaea archaeon]|nr:30S ribosomal protein S4e [Hadesarchaea archaeon]